MLVTNIPHSWVISVGDTDRDITKMYLTIHVTYQNYYYLKFNDFLKSF